MSPQNYAVVTGASSGIGLEIAKQLAEKNYNLFLVARNEKALTELKKEILASKPDLDIQIILADLSLVGASREVVAKIQAVTSEIEVLVNNAGAGVFKEFEKIPLEDQIANVQLNAISLTEMTYLLLPFLRKHGKGYILNTSSIGGLMPGGVYMAIYGAAKAFVTSLSQALAEELRGENIFVTVLHPGGTRTQFASRMGLTGSMINFGTSPEKVAKTGLKALFAKRPFVIDGTSNVFLIGLLGVLPRSWAMKVVKLIMSHAKIKD